MINYDHTLTLDTINSILIGLAKSAEVNTPSNRDHTRALELLAEKKRRRYTGNHFQTTTK
jgi:hypothetical protein